MKSFRFALASVIGFAALAQTPIAPAPRGKSALVRKVLENFGQSALTLEQNRGQAPQGIDFVALGLGHKFLVSPNGTTLQLFDVATKRSDSVEVQLVGANRASHGEGLDRIAFTSAYFSANDPQGLLRSLPNYAQARYRQVWPGIDVVYYGNRNQLEYDMRVAPKADPNAIRIKLAGRYRFALNSAGDLDLQTPYGLVTHHRPQAFQMIDHHRREVRASYALVATNEVRIQLGKYDRSRELVIDPTLSVSSPTVSAPINAVAFDGAGNMFVAASDGAGTSAVIAANSTGATLNVGTFVGADTLSGIAVTGSGIAERVYLTGSSSSTGFFTSTGAYQGQLKDPNGTATDAYFVQYDPDLTHVPSSNQHPVYSTFFGGLGNDSGKAIAIDSSANGYITGQTVGGSGFVHTVGGAFVGGGTDAFVAKFNPALSGAASLVFSTFIGGNGADSGNGMGVDSNGNSYVGGSTTSTSASFLPSSATGFNPSKATATNDGFIVKLNASGTAALYLTFLPLAPVNALAVDGSFSAFVTGAVDGTTNALSTTGSGFQLTNGGNGCASVPGVPPGSPCTDAYLSRYNTLAGGNASLMYSTYLGGNLSDVGTGVAVDNSGDAWVAGRTNSSNFPIATPLTGMQTYRGGAIVDSNTLNTQFDAFVAKINTNNAGQPSLIYSTYLGGTATDQANAIAVDAAGDALIGGTTASTDFPNLSGAPAATGTHGFFAEITNNPVSTPTLTVNRTQLNFGYSGSLITSPQTVTVSIAGGQNVGWTVSSDQPNVTVSPSSGTGSGTFQVTATSPAGGGSPTAIITVSSPGANGSPQQVHVSVASVATQPPFGSFDTPTNNLTGVAGAIAVTGWVLDTVEVTSVRIYREPAPGEGSALAFIGDAVFVADARPDVAATYPGSPYQYRAGWGYQMLTNFLPNSSGSGPLGNGTYNLHALATNANGTVTDLGTRTITVDNAHASKPFGTIDTPSQGGTASGSAYVNFAWALTQNPYAIPIDGSTIFVYLDGVAVGHPVYNRYRSDIATLFPGYANSNGAVGFFMIDTTQLKNKVHTISWSVTDNGNRTDGIGSRYFTVFNAGGGGVAAPEDPPTPESLAGPVQLRSGYDVNAPAAVIAPDDSGSYAVEMEQSGRIELSLGATTGYQIVGQEAAELPLGSTLKAGVFYWQPPLGFFGKYELVFERENGSQIHTRVNIVPKHYSR